MSRKLLPEEAQGGGGASARLRAGDKPVVLPDAEGGQSKAGGGNARYDATVMPAYVTAVLNQPSLRISLLPKIKEVGLRHLFQKLFVVRGKNGSAWGQRGPGALPGGRRERSGNPAGTERHTRSGAGTGELPQY